MKTRIMYLENKKTGEAHIGRVTFSRTMQTVYYQDKVLQRGGSESIKGNFSTSLPMRNTGCLAPKSVGATRI